MFRQYNADKRSLCTHVSTMQWGNSCVLSLVTIKMFITTKIFEASQQRFTHKCNANQLKSNFGDTHGLVHNNLFTKTLIAENGFNASGAPQ